MLQEQIDTYLQEQYHNKKINLAKKWSPSSFGRCFRYQYLSRKNTPPTNPPDSRALRIFACGNIFHKFVENFYPNVQKEVLVENDDIKGYADLVLPNCALDIKSVHSKSFWWINKPNYDFSKEKFKEILQLMTYAWLLNKDRGILVLVSKDDLCIDERIFHLNQWQGHIHAELRTLRAAWEFETLPKPEPRFNNECKYCIYKDKCAEELRSAGSVQQS